MEKYRTFIAVPLRVGEEFLHARAALMERLSGDRISWVNPERYHVTLKFLGDTSLFENLKKEVDCALESFGIPPVDQPFRAHLTLGRIRSLKDQAR